MKQNKLSEGSENDNIKYRKDQLRKLCTSFNISRNRIMTLFGQTNPVTADRWLNGEDIYIKPFLKICNEFDINILQFFSYKGHNFKTSLDTIARIEESGIDLDAFVESHNIEGNLPNERIPIHNYLDEIEILKKQINDKNDLIIVLKENISLLKEKINNTEVNK